MQFWKEDYHSTGLKEWIWASSSGRMPNSEKSSRTQWKSTIKWLRGRFLTWERVLKVRNGSILRMTISKFSPRKKNKKISKYPTINGVDCGLASVIEKSPTFLVSQSAHSLPANKERQTHKYDNSAIKRNKSKPISYLTNGQTIWQFRNHAKWQQANVLRQAAILIIFHI